MRLRRRGMACWVAASGSGRLMIARGVSDLDTHPGNLTNGKERTVTVRFRVDGDCIAYQEIPSAYRLPLVARFKMTT